MGRSTQYIGLTKAAHTFVSTLTRVPTDYNFTEGMCGEKVSLGVWEPNDELRAQGIVLIEEFEQISPWSSGPMIFTALRYIDTNGNATDHFEWVEDPKVVGEVDWEGGRYYV